MKTLRLPLIVLCGLLLLARASATTYYVDVNSTNPTPPYATWSTASTDIQSAINAATNGDLVLVTNGLYATGSKSMDGYITNRISVNKALTVQSVNGPSVTIIQGAYDPTSTNGPGAVRCAWLTNNAVLSGFTLRGGATSSSGPTFQAWSGAGVWGTTNRFNVLPSAMVTNCFLTLNVAALNGGGAYQVQLNNCTIVSNSVVGISKQGGGASACSLRNCMVTGNYAGGYGGGTDHSLLNNCVVIGNSAGQVAGGAYYGTLINCTVTKNSLTSASSDNGGGASYAALTNCIVFANQEADSYGVNSNYMSCTFAFSCSLPLPSGMSNISTDPQLLADGVHLAATSPCIGAGTASVVSGTDIDGQPWNNPPSIGCDEWQPAPVVSAPPVYQIGTPACGLTFSVIAGGQLPFTFFWSKDGASVQDDGHQSNSGTANLVVNNFGPNDAGLYQVVVSNAFGVVTSQLAQVVIHVVDVTGANPVAPYATWATAATNIQDAIDSASTGDIVLVTNGVYATGGKSMDGAITNRVSITKTITVVSASGPWVTTIQGMWDPTSTNGPGAVRCAWLTNGAVLNGFTLQNGATRSTGNVQSESGGGAWCNSTNAVVSNCILSNNSAFYYGGGIKSGTLNNSLVINNQAASGGGAYSTTLNNCTVIYNYAINHNSGGGTYAGIVNNSIVVFNYDYNTSTEDDYSSGGVLYSYNSCMLSGTAYPLAGTGNISVNPQFVDLYHIGSASPCVGTGNALYATGMDFDGEAWLNPPSMGCVELVASNLVGPLSVSIFGIQTNSLVNHFASFWGTLTGRASGTIWTFGDGNTATNTGINYISHRWTNSGDYSITYTAYNNDNPAGVSTNITIHVLPINAPQLQSAMLLTNGFQFQFARQLDAYYTIQYATNLTPPVTWQTWQGTFYSTGDVYQITDPAATNATQFYRVIAQ
jgi:hypothetical protein